MSELTDEQYNVLLTFRFALREFLRWSEQEAAEAGLTAQQHQVLLVIRAHSEDDVSVGDVADYLQIRHHSAVGLVSRVEALGLLERRRDGRDQRIVRLRLTPRGRTVIDRLSKNHLAELEQAAAMLHISEDFLQHLSQDFIERVPREHA